MIYGAGIGIGHRMQRPRVRRAVWIAAALMLVAGLQPRQAADQSRTAKKQLNPISADEFARLIRDFSEPSGYFSSENLVSNETSYLHIVDKLKALGASGGAYLGVGPEQNFTYIAQIRPQIAFVVDIRRQAVIQHLMFKALFLRAPTRTQFLSMLFSKPVIGTGPGPNASAPELVDYFSRTATDPKAFEKNLEAIAAAVADDCHFRLDEKDRASLEHVYSAFANASLNLRYGPSGFSSGSRYRYWGARGFGDNFPTFGDLVLETDLHGRYGNFLASRADYDFLRSLQQSNRIIPIVGDFAGTKALAMVADYLRKNGYKVTAFYTSNVEQYLFQNRVFDEFVRNVQLLPVTDKSLFIRAYPNRRMSHPARIGNHTLTTLLEKITVFLDDYRQDLYPDYWSLVSTHYISAGR